LYKNLDRSFYVLSQFTRVTDRLTDGQTDGQTEFSSLDRVCIPCSAIKTAAGNYIEYLCSYIFEIK